MPLRHSIVLLPTSVYPSLHVKFTVLPCSKLLPFLAPYRGIPGSLQSAKNNANKNLDQNYDMFP